jgi:hypothetical protein
MISEAILKINPNAQFTIIGNDINTCEIEWLEGTAEISKADIQAKINETQYQRDRVYPSIGDQLDMQYKDLLNGTTTWKDAVAKVKSDNPKE